MAAGIVGEKSCELVHQKGEYFALGSKHTIRLASAYTTTFLRGNPSFYRTIGLSESLKLKFITKLRFCQEATAPEWLDCSMFPFQ